MLGDLVVWGPISYEGCYSWNLGW